MKIADDNQFATRDRLFAAFGKEKLCAFGHRCSEVASEPAHVCFEVLKSGETGACPERLPNWKVRKDLDRFVKNREGYFVVLFEAGDLGVMVPCQDILDAAQREQADIIGLSGLITPSLDEMVHVASEMQRLGFEQPLLIGGATTSPAHTSVKIDPCFDGAVIYVKDASRAVGVAQQLVGREAESYKLGIKADCERRRISHARPKRRAPALTIREARAAERRLDWAEYPPPVPEQKDDVSARDLVPYIDWMPFFNAWEFHGKFPDILDDEVVGEAVTALYQDAQRMLDQMLAEDWIEIRACVGFFPANANGDDIVVYEDANRDAERATIHCLRQQKRRRADLPQECLADFVAPATSEIDDYVGGFVVTAGGGVESRAQAFEADNDDYSAILLKALADRFAEAGAEYLHQRVRREWWGYAPDETFSNDQLIDEAYSGIRPAPGYPACPDHTLKHTLFELLEAPERTGVTLTESCAMAPAASVSGWYLSHPESRYFALGPIDLDQVEDYAVRRGLDVVEVERWLAPILGYEPGDRSQQDAA